MNVSNKVFRKRCFVVLFCIGSFIFISGIALFFLDKNIGIITVFIGLIIMLPILIGYLLTLFSKDPEAVVTIVLLIIGLTVLSISIGQGILKIVNDCFLKEDKVAMIGYYSSLISGVFSGIIGVAGAIIGAKIGAEKSYKAAMEQIKYDREKLNNEKEEEKKKAQQIIDSLLKYEITYNFDKFILSNSENKNIVVKQFNNSSNSDMNFYNYFGADDEHKGGCFKFAEFNNIKYSYLNYMSEEIINIYQMFRILEDKKSFEKFTEKEFNHVKETYLKYYEKYEA